jgi:hypothetical protein
MSKPMKIRDIFVCFSLFFAAAIYGFVATSLASNLVFFLVIIIPSVVMLFHAGGEPSLLRTKQTLAIARGKTPPTRVDMILTVVQSILVVVGIWSGYFATKIV